MIQLRRRRMRLRRPVKRWRAVFLIAFFLIVLMVVQSLFFIETNLRPAFVNVAETIARQYATETINDAIVQKIATDQSYKDIVQFIKDDKGNIRSAVFNMPQANRIEAQTTEQIQSVLKEMNQSEIRLPVGQALHSSILATFGPDIPITVVPVSAVNSEITEESNSLGINQTKHSLILNVKVRVNVIIPFVTKPVDVQAKVPIASFVMVGDVPSVFYDVQGTPFMPVSPPVYPNPSAGQQQK
ncbi:sporulation protein YunB [Effusibacillus dendaii]|uniref:Sporulation protein YunB n=1 Tax=Effusibacillus dendaii TaxID=2743772 RepID=A0A7I8DD11_9BACL|nr:sporulation protein YunB [Effusibacillus dendaii]BCJ88103.1 sporulation protein YunB [Effusibacillus dendaii]